ncbi:hypothetical protein SETIT_2G220100v2 [Setaria italica]|uniref:Uncharacterized protein n=1 Tax=Setaria italica TaxID=4555 RepID=A0A368Q1D7_SETIT|nr:hypothetical protein SETIT_2G220100v2 [Setaria italica]
MPQAVQVGEREGAVDPKSETIFCQIEINQTYFHKDYTISFSYFKWYRPINQNQDWDREQKDAEAAGVFLPILSWHASVTTLVLSSHTGCSHVSNRNLR